MAFLFSYNLVSFQILVQVLHILRELTIKLQMKAMDVVYAYKLVNKVVYSLKSMRLGSSLQKQQELPKFAWGSIRVDNAKTLWEAEAS